MAAFIQVNQRNMLLTLVFRAPNKSLFALELV